MRNWTQTRTVPPSGGLQYIKARYASKRGSGVRAEIAIDLDGLEYMIEKAIQSKGQKATDCGGAVVVRAIKQETDH